MFGRAGSREGKRARVKSRFDTHLVATMIKTGVPGKGAVGIGRVYVNEFNKVLRLIQKVSGSQGIIRTVF